ncbi:contractile injection system protein, VgrG/Pvc8 family [Streptomyces goshikiensis]|uniref:contractile injection system protein, VgrG/Pvc8 family n=1 Tax=Streptomyces goshikiensis TaxID=1942 RepID=UPI00364F8326
METPALGRGKWVTDVVITQAEDLHEVAEVTVIHRVPRGTSSGAGWSLDRYGILAEGTPMAIRYGTAAQPRTFYGYVASPAVRGDSAPQASAHSVQVPVVYTLLGPTSSMQSQTNRIWSTATASYIARHLTRSAGLRPQIQRHNRLFDSLVQQATSDFTFLRGLAKEVGYRLVASGTTLSLTDPLVSLREPHEAVRGFLFAKSHRDTMQTFHSTAGQSDPRGGLRTRREGYSYNPTTKALVRQVAADTQDAALTQYSSSRPFASQTEAQHALRAEARRDALWVHATATVIGDATLRPGMEVALDGDALGPNDRGQWMVRSATHRLSVVPGQPPAGRYWTDIVLGRNRRDGLDLVSKEAVTEALPDRTTLVRGRWQAQQIGRA